MTVNNPGIAVMASFSDYGLTSKEGRGLVAEDTTLPRPLADAQGALARFCKRVGVSLDGAPREVAQRLTSMLVAAPGATKAPGSARRADATPEP